MRPSPPAPRGCSRSADCGCGSTALRPVHEPAAVAAGFQPASEGGILPPGWEAELTGSQGWLPPRFKGADYFLTGKLQSLTVKAAAGTSDYVLYSFELIDARTTVIVWADQAEIKKQGLEDAAYR